MKNAFYFLYSEKCIRFQGTVLSTFFWGYATTQLIGGHFADKIGGDIVIVISCIGWSGLTLFTPLIPYLITEPTLLLFVMTFVRVIIGVSQGQWWTYNVLTKRLAFGHDR